MKYVVELTFNASDASLARTIRGVVVEALDALGPAFKVSDVELVVGGVRVSDVPDLAPPDLSDSLE